MKLWFFNWIGGGYNSVWACDRDAAIVEIGKKFDSDFGAKLKPDLATLRVVTVKELIKIDDAHASLFY